MGNGRWSASTYLERADARGGADAFGYSADAIRSRRLKPHQTLDPQGLLMRESRDSAEHPQSNAIFISLDVTGSMGKVVRGIHADLPQLHELLLGHNYIPDPQILFAAVGDATCDAVPLQIGQFESDNRMDQNLENMILEGGGGGQNTESYELMMYVAARHTAIDCWEKRRHKGYFFMIGDEMAYPLVKGREVYSIIGDPAHEDIPVASIIEEVKQRYHLYYLIPGGAAHGADRRIIDFWCRHVGQQNVIQLDSPNETSECIGLAIGVNEGAISMSDGIDRLRKRGVVGRTIESITQALASVFTGNATPTDRKRRL